MLDALEPCCAHAVAKLTKKTAANSTFPMLPPQVVPRRRQCYCAAWSLRWSGFTGLGDLEMIKTLMAVALAGAFALPMASALGDSAPGAAAPDTPAIGGTTAKQGRFEALDKNHDGFVSRDEAKDAEELNTRFSELDS